jgi:3-oxoacyl-[acyl-carrier protein] reductase
VSVPSKGTKYSTQIQINREKILAFAEFSGDQNPLHICKRAAQEYGLTKPVSHGAVLLAEISRIIGMELPGEGAFWTDIQIEFLRPVYCDETVAIDIEVLQDSQTLKMVKLRIDASVGERKVLGGTCRVVCLEKLGRRLPVLNISERMAVVTGGSRGLGLEIVKQLLQSGYRTVSLSRKSSADLEQLKEEYGQLDALFVDLKDPIKLEAEIEKLGLDGINVVIHAASPVPVQRNLGKDLYGDIIALSEIYLHSLIHLICIAAPFMKKKKYGRIVTIGTSFILGTPPPSMYAYVTAKEALWGLTKSLSVEYGKYGVTANMVSPSMMLTDMTSEIPNALKKAEAESNPIKRLVEPDEVAKTVAFLCSENASFINGTNIPLTGGKF